jgi:hypothetical protein
MVNRILHIKQERDRHAKPNYKRSGVNSGVSEGYLVHSHKLAPIVVLIDMTEMFLKLAFNTHYLYPNILRKCVYMVYQTLTQVLLNNL